MPVIRLIRGIKDVSSEIIDKYDNVIISIPPHNFKKLNKIKKELEFLLSRGKEYSLISGKTDNGIEYLNCLRTN